MMQEALGRGEPDEEGEEEEKNYLSCDELRSASSLGRRPVGFTSPDK